MIEFFVGASICNKLNNKNKQQNKKIIELFSNNETILPLLKSSINMDAFHLVVGIISLIISIFSAKLAYECNMFKSPSSQVISVLFGFFFSGFYLTYYFIWHVLLQNKC
jgi:hypothetical protein